MSARTRLADWIVTRLLGGARPGGRTAVKLIEPGGMRATWVFDGDAIEVYYHDPAKGDVHVRVTHSPANAVLLARAILRWWSRELWHGWKLRLWSWATRVRSENSSAGTIAEVVRIPRRVK